VTTAFLKNALVFGLKREGVWSKMSVRFWVAGVKTEIRTPATSNFQ
jgi:hypothetical protein